MKSFKNFREFNEDSVNEAANNLRFKYVIGKDFENHGVVDFVKGNTLYVEINGDGDTVPYNAKDVYVLSDDDQKIIVDAMVKGEIVQNGDPKEFEKYIKKRIKLK